jgi:PAS domain S-box-containing protein
MQPIGATEEATVQAVFQSVPDAMVGIDANGIIRLANPQVEALFGYASDELVGQSVDVLVPDHVRLVHASHRRRYVEHPRTRAMGAGLQLAARRKDGTEFPADIALSTLTTRDGMLVTAAVRDVSEQWAWAERERLQGQLHQSQRLESIGQLAGGIAHDFNNLLVVILNYATFVLDGLDGPPAPDPQDEAAARLALRDDVEQIRRAAERAAALTHQLLIFGRADAVSPEVLDLNMVVEDLDKLLRRTIAERVRLTTNLQPGLWPVVVDRGQMEQVLVNLAVNARDAMPGGGALDVLTANVDVPPGADPALPSEAGRYVRLTVSDTGTGMTADVAERAFEPFFTTKPRGEGAGLGLATVYGAVANAGGLVRLDTQPGVGTTFNVYLPISPDALPTRTSAEAVVRLRGEGEAILVAEDEPEVRELVRRILVNGGYHPIITSTPEEALDVASRDGVTLHALLTDVVMPGMSGPELHRRVAEVRPGLRVIFMSGYSSRSEQVDEELPLLPKPFTAAALLAAVEHVLSSAG